MKKISVRLPEGVTPPPVGVTNAIDTAVRDSLFYRIGEEEYEACLASVVEELSSLCKEEGLPPPAFTSNDFLLSVVLSALDNVHTNVRSYLLHTLASRGAIRVPAVDTTSVERTRTVSELFRLETVSPLPLPLPSRRRIYSRTGRLSRLVASLLPSEEVPPSLPSEVEGWRVEVVRRSSSPHDAEAFRDSFRVVNEGEGDMRKGDTIHSEVTPPLSHNVFRAAWVYKGFANVFTLQANLVLRLSRGRRVYYHTSRVNLFWFTVEQPPSRLVGTSVSERRRYTLSLTRSLRHVPSLSPLGWAERQAERDLASQAGLFVVLWWMEGATGVEEREGRLRRLDEACKGWEGRLPLPPSSPLPPSTRSLLAGWYKESEELVPLSFPPPKEGRGWAVRRRDGSLASRRGPALSNDFVGVVRLFADCLMASHVLRGSVRAIDYVSPESVQDTFY